MPRAVAALINPARLVEGFLLHGAATSEVSLSVSLKFYLTVKFTVKKRFRYRITVKSFNGKKGMC